MRLCIRPHPRPWRTAQSPALSPARSPSLHPQLSRYAGRQTAATVWFAGFALSWIVLRVFIYPRVIVLNCLRAPVEMVAMPYNINPQVSVCL